MTEVLVAVIAAVPASIAAIAAVKAAHRTKTSNGSTLGQQADKTVDRLASVELKLDEHLRNHERDRGA